MEMHQRNSTNLHAKIIQEEMYKKGSKRYVRNAQKPKNYFK